MDGKGHYSGCTNCGNSDSGTQMQVHIFRGPGRVFAFTTNPSEQTSLPSTHLGAPSRPSSCRKMCPLLALTLTTACAIWSHMVFISPMHTFGSPKLQFGDHIVCR